MACYIAAFYAREARCKLSGGVDLGAYKEALLPGWRVAQTWGVSVTLIDR
ncbi:MAG: hypothetical protein AAFY29_09330 [Pseudomonadota bacterium]